MICLRQINLFTEMFSSVFTVRWCEFERGWRKLVLVLISFILAYYCPLFSLNRFRQLRHGCLHSSFIYSTFPASVMEALSKMLSRRSSMFAKICKCKGQALWVSDVCFHAFDFRHCHNWRSIWVRVLLLDKGKRVVFWGTKGSLLGYSICSLRFLNSFFF